jgi:5-methylcytosine-specific restriction endonuclease McrA
VIKRYQSSEKGRLTRKLLGQGEKAQNRLRLWLAANQERREQYVRKWLKTPQGKEYMARRNFHRRAAVERTPAKEVLNSVQWNEIKRTYNYSCVYCGVIESVVVKLTRDHIIPVTKGGLHTKENIVPACQPCNARKGTKHLERLLPA